MHRLSSVFVVAVAALTGCAGEGSIAEDGRDDAFTTDGKLDGFQCTPEEAAAILKVANEASLATLKNDVQLAVKAADNIIAYRNGDDEDANTSDDETFGSLAELDGIPYIGPTAFQKLLDYVHDADLVGPPPAPTAQWTITTIGNGGNASFAVAPDGRPVLAFESTGGYKLQQADGTIVALPTDVSGFYNDQLSLAVDENGVPHVMYRPNTNSSNAPTGFNHASYKNGAWTQHAPIPGSKMWVDQSPSGKIFALVRSYSCSNCVAPLAIHAIAPDGTKTSEQLWSVSNDTDMGFQVDSAGFPSVVYGSGLIRHARRNASGWRTFDVANQVGSDGVATTGGDNATVFASDDGVRTFRQSGTSFSQLDDITFTAFTPHLDATSDAVGTAHGCFQRSGNLVHVQAETTGNVSSQSLGVADDGCWLGTDASGKLHLLFTQGNVINHGTYE